MKTYDFIVVGGGRASNFAKKAASKGKKVAIIEKDLLGGTCPNRGCIPSKILFGYSNTAREINASNKFHIDSNIKSINMKQIFEDVNSMIAKVHPRYVKMLEGVDIYKGVASFKSDKVISVNGELLSADKILIATGSRPVKAPFNALTSDDLFPFKKEVPKSITIVGGGVIACEIASFFSALGVKTTMVIRSDKLLGNLDKDIESIFKEQASKYIDFKFNATIKNAKLEKGGYLIDLEQDGKTTSYKNDLLLYAIGRVSNADLLALENTSIKTNKKGFIEVDENYETHAKGVYALGDATGRYMLQHAASYEVNHVGKILLGEDTSFKYVPHGISAYEDSKVLNFRYMPQGIFAYPEIAIVGLSEEEAKKQKIPYVASISDWSNSAKALSIKESFSRIKLLINPNSYEILGAHLIGHESATFMHQILAIMHVDNDIRYLKDMLYIHPALNEALLNAAVQVVSKAKNA